MEMSIPHRICTEISQTGDIWKVPSRNRENDKASMWKERCGDNPSERVSRPYPHAGKHTAEDECVAVYGNIKGQDELNDIWPFCKPEVQVWELTFLVQGILCRHGRTQQRSNCEIHKEPVGRRPVSGTNKYERVLGPVYGWADRRRQIKTATRWGWPPENVVRLADPRGASSACRYQALIGLNQTTGLAGGTWLKSIRGAETLRYRFRPSVLRKFGFSFICFNGRDRQNKD